MIQFTTRYQHQFWDPKELDSSFTQEETRPEGVIALDVAIGSPPRSINKLIHFYVVKANSPYNLILGRDWLNAVRAIVSPYHLLLKIPTSGGILTVRGDQQKAKECMQIALRGQPQA